MQNIKEFLARFTTLAPRGALVRQEAAEAMMRVCGITKEQLPPIEYQNKIIYVRCSGALKHALILKKTELLECVQKKLPIDSVRDIR